MWELLGGIGIIFGAKGVNMLAMKRVQVQEGSGLQQGLLFTALYSLTQTICALLIPPYRALSVAPEAILFPTAYSVLYVVAYVMLLKAYAMGPVAVTNSIWAFNSTVVIGYSAFAWGETLSWYQIAGLAFFLAGLVIFSRSSYGTGAGEKKKVTFKWLVLAVATSLVIGAASTITKGFLRVNPDMRREMLVYYPLSATLICVPFALIMNPSGVRHAIRSLPFVENTFLAAAMCTLWNWVYVRDITLYPSAVFLPMYSVATMLANLFFGRVFLKERISKSAMVAMGLSLIAIVLLNI